MNDQPCALCRQLFPPAQLAPVNGRAVCAGCKPLLLHRVLSGAPEPLLPADVELRELGFGEMLARAVVILRGEGLRMLLLVVGVSLLSSGILELLPKLDDTTFPGLMTEIGRTWAVDIFVGVIAALGVSWLVRERMEGRRGSLVLALAQVRRRWLAGVGTAGLESVVLIVCFLLLVVPAIVVVVFLSFTTITVALSERSGLGAFSYSKQLVAGRWWRVFGYSLATFLPVLFFAMGIGMLKAVLPQITTPEWVDSLIIVLLELPAVVCMTVLYLHLDAQQRVREAAGGGE